MSRYIDAEWLKIALELYRVVDLSEAPSIDIIRCGECKYRKHRVDFQNDYCIKHSKVLYDTGGGCSWGKE